MKRLRAILLCISRNDKISSFAKNVYRAVLKIPAGEVMSYGWVAASIGKPGASRAVGNALAGNPYPIDVPCHRVIKSDGSIGGYIYGPDAKRSMLKAEGVDLADDKLL